MCCCAKQPFLIAYLVTTRLLFLRLTIGNRMLFRHNMHPSFPTEAAPFTVVDGCAFIRNKNNYPVDIRPEKQMNNEHGNICCLHRDKQMCSSSAVLHRVNKHKLTSFAGTQCTCSCDTIWRCTPAGRHIYIHVIFTSAWPLLGLIRELYPVPDKETPRGDGVLDGEL